MVFQPITILYVVIVFSFIVTSVFMFKPKGDERLHLIFFWLAVALSVLVTVVNATSHDASMTNKVIAAWAGLLFSGIGIIVRMAAGKTNAVANVLVMVSSLYGVAGYLLLN
ncbi:MAG: hypothetical protein E7571_00015 [Ruminococcaceae bacterium]|nr:hypothetical protein [Oscillospiraceae bacterium]